MSYSRSTAIMSGFAPVPVAGDLAPLS